MLGEPEDQLSLPHEVLNTRGGKKVKFLPL
jgi:hypothetical protein